MDAVRRITANTFSSLKVRNFRLYFVGHIASQSGTWMQTVALGWLILELTNSGTQLGIITALQFIPLLILGPWGGLYADTHKKRNILYVTQISFSVLVFAISALVYAELIQVWMLYVFSLGLGFIRIFDNPARQTFVSELVDSDNVRNAVSLNSTAGNAARVIGPSIGGILIAGIGIGTCFLFNALSYIVTIVMLSRMRESEFYAVKQQKKGKGQLKEGFAYVLETPLIKNTLILIAFIGTFAYEWQVSLPLLAVHVFQGDAGSYAALLSALGAGSVIGGLYAAGRKEIVPSHLTDLALIFGLCLIGTALMPTIEFAVLGMVIVGFFSINLTSLGNTMLQLESKPEMRGRVLSLWSMAMIGSTAIGGPIVGLVGEYWGARWGLGIGGVVAVVIATYFSRTLIKERFVRIIPHWLRNPDISVER